MKRNIYAPLQFNKYARRNPIGIKIYYSALGPSHESSDIKYT